MATIINPEFFAQYDANNNEINSLMSADADLANATATMTQATNEVRNAQSQLASNQALQQRYIKRIHRNENPRFFHYFVPNRAKKIEILKIEQQNTIAQQAPLEANVQTAIGKQQGCQASLNNATQVKQHRDACIAKRANMFEQCVTSNPPTPRLAQIDANLHQQQNVIVHEQQLIQTMATVITTIRQAEGQFQQSLIILNRAEAWNNAATVQDGWDGVSDFELWDQQRRDALINEARIPAIRAYEITAQAWHMFPVELRMRYPQVAAQIGKVPLPILQGAQFGAALSADLFGFVGAAMNDFNAGCKIQQNKQSVMGCMQILQQQITMCNSLVVAMNGNVAKMQANLKTLSDQREAERIAIFESIRHVVCNQPVVVEATEIPIVQVVS